MHRHLFVATLVALATVSMQPAVAAATVFERNPEAPIISFAARTTFYNMVAQANAANALIFRALPGTVCQLDYNSSSPQTLEASADGRIAVYFIPLATARMPQTRVLACTLGSKVQYMQVVLHSGQNVDAIRIKQLQPALSSELHGAVPQAVGKNYDDGNYVGFFAQGPVGTFSSVFGSITVPNFSLSQIPPGAENGSLYVAIDGGCLSNACSQNIFQAGVQMILTDQNNVLAEQYRVFAQATGFGFQGSFYAAPDDVLFCHVEYKAVSGQVNMNSYCYDERTGQTMNTTFPNVGSQAVRDTAEWYISKYPYTSYLFNFGTASITGADVMVGTSLFGIQNLVQETTYPVSSVQMVNQYGVQLAGTSPAPPALPSTDAVGFSWLEPGP